jgi:MFS transporter, AAHS family, 4-hydroxybenzoate transporter
MVRDFLGRVRHLEHRLHYAEPDEGAVSRAGNGRPRQLRELIAYPIGSLGLGWLSDHYGRKLTLIIGCLIVAVFTYSTVFVTSAEGLAAMRVLTGIGLGGIIPNIVALGSEFAPKRLRARLIIFTFCGINFGGFLCGLVAPSIIAAWGWRGLFYVGGTVPFVAVILMGCLWQNR